MTRSLARFSLVMIGMVAACSAPPGAVVTPTADYSTLRETQWVLTSLNGHDPIAGSQIALDFGDGDLSGSTGCNAFGTVSDPGNPSLSGGPYYATGDGQLRFPDVALTAANCAEPVGVMEQETEYLPALHAITHYAVGGNELQLTDDQGTSALAMHGDKELLRSIETGVL